jgi:transcription initiation factor TFIID TATA-box-binding protein
MDSLTTHPSTAVQAKAFVAPTSLSYPGGTPAELTPPSSEKNAPQDANAVNGVQTPAPTPDTQNSASGIIPTLQ